MKKGCGDMLNIDLMDVLDNAVSVISYEFDEDTYHVDVIGGISVKEDVLRDVLGNQFSEETLMELVDVLNDSTREVSEFIKDTDDRYVGLTDMVYDWEARLLDNNEIWIEVSVVDFYYDAAERISYMRGL